MKLEKRFTALSVKYWRGFGVIQAMEILTPPVSRNVAELIRQVKAFQHVRETGEATPSGWQPGKVIMKPGPDQVSKVWEVWKPEMAF
ncbi:hypothetical protein H8E77_05335 [bacterium]|nr:hypothetical protein [bacterium]